MTPTTQKVMAYFFIAKWKRNLFCVQSTMF